MNDLKPCGFCGKIDYWQREVRCGVDNTVTVADPICRTCHPPLEKLKEEWDAQHRTD